VNPVPMWIPTTGGQVFAWYHAPAPGRARDCAVLFCDPFGWHRMVLHLPYRNLALRLAGSGFHVLRVDYPGTCDSEGWPRESARFQTWLQSLDTALDALKKWSNAAHLALFGALLGGTLGAALAGRRKDVTALALWGAYMHGRTAVRAELAVAEALNRGAHASASPAADGDREAIGFLLSGKMIQDLKRLDLLQAAFAGVRNALVIPRTPGSHAEARLARHLATQGTAVDFHSQPSEDLDAILHQGGAGDPKRTIEDVAGWLERKFARTDHTPAATTASLYPPEVVLPVLGTRIRESAVFFGADRGIFGIASERLDRPPQDPTVVLVSGGRNHRSGINRNYTEWARRLAVLGHSVLRIDLRGLGDSPLPPSERADVLYNARRRRDVLDAVAWLKARGSRRVVCVGLCSGSYQAFHAALEGDAVGGVVMLNPLAFHSDRADDTNRPGKLHKIARRMQRRLHRLARSLFPQARILTPAERRIARSFVQLCERGVDVCVVYNDNEPYLGFLQRALRPVRDHLDASGRFRIETVQGSDHIHSPLAAQAQVTEILLRYIGSLAAAPPANDVQPVLR
jgi:pimeloyl-ACP methyl ester carboxylesterase